MDLIDRLLKEHEQLRRALASMMDSLAQAQHITPRAQVAQVEARLDRLRGLIQAHEAAEETLLAEALGAAGESCVDARARIEDSHHSLDALLALVGALGRFSEEDQFAAVRFAACQLRECLERHLSYEETVVFPALRRAVPAEALARLGDRVLAA